MKRFILTLAFFLGLVSYSFAQGNLQFNQVINQNYTANVINAEVIMGTITVPAGKVLKIETCSFTYASPAMFVRTSSSDQVFIGGNTVFIGATYGREGYLPLWLSEGTYDVVARVSSSASSTVSFSAIEFNVIP